MSLTGYGNVKCRGYSPLYIIFDDKHLLCCFPLILFITTNNILIYSKVEAVAIYESWQRCMFPLSANCSAFYRRGKQPEKKVVDEEGKVDSNIAIVISKRSICEAPANTASSA